MITRRSLFRGAVAVPAAAALAPLAAAAPVHVSFTIPAFDVESFRRMIHGRYWDFSKLARDYAALSTTDHAEFDRNVAALHGSEPIVN